MTEKTFLIGVAIFIILIVVYDRSVNRQNKR